MEETLERLESAYENALRAYLASEGTEHEAQAYRCFLDTFEALKAFETEVWESRAAATA